MTFGFILCWVQKLIAEKINIRLEIRNVKVIMLRFRRASPSLIGRKYHLCWSNEFLLGVNSAGSIFVRDMKKKLLTKSKTGTKISKWNFYLKDTGLNPS